MDGLNLFYALRELWRRALWVLFVSEFSGNPATYMDGQLAEAKRLVAKLDSITTSSLRSCVSIPSVIGICRLPHESKNLRMSFSPVADEATMLS